MFGAEVAVGYVCAYLVRKARRAGGAADAEVDRAVGAGMEHLHGLVTRVLGDDRALQRAESQAAADGAVGERTQRRLVDALTDAVEDDPAFDAELRAAVKALRAAEAACGRTVLVAGNGIAVGGNIDIRASGGSA